MLKKLMRLASIIDQPGVLRELLFNPAFSVAAWQINRSLFHYVPSISCIIDCGANNGQFTLAAHARYEKASIYSFEPVPDTFQRLQKSTANLSRIQSFNFGLGDLDGFMHFYENQYSQASSGLKLIEGNNTKGLSVEHTKRIQVPVHRLDSLTQLIGLERPSLLKLDVQGYEKKVLEGAIGILHSVDYIILETAYEPLYEDQPLFNEMNQYLEDEGYCFVAVLDFHINRQSRIEEMDVLYKRL